MRRTVIWDLIGGVVETVETSRQLIQELLSEVEKNKFAHSAKYHVPPKYETW